MTCKYSFLSIDQYSGIYRAFLEAFSDYAVDMSYMNESNMLNRWIKNGVDFSCSVGAFHGDKIVGFTMIGIGFYKGQLSAFDAGTGIIPAFRGKGLASAMFDFAIPKLKGKEVKRFYLDVLQSNRAGIRAYEKSGFTIARRYNCYELRLTNQKFPAYDPRHIQVLPIDRELIYTFANELDWTPAWENSFFAISGIPDDLLVLGAFRKGICIGIIIYYPAIQWIHNILVRKEYRKQGIASRLLSYLLCEISIDTQLVKVINIQDTDVAMDKLVRKFGFSPVTGQYEMELTL